jgi:hypothetical protein
MADYDYSDLISSGMTPAEALIQALRSRQVGGILQGSGNKGLMAAGQGLEQGAQQDLARGLQERHLGIQEQQMGNTMRHQQALETLMAGRLGVQQQGVDLKKTEQGATTDAFGNPILYQKHGGGGALPGAVAASGPKGGTGASAGGGMGFSASAMDQLAEQFAATGTLPQVGRGRAAPAIIRQIVNRAAELHPDTNLAGNKAGYRADTASLTKQQQLLDLTQSWEATGKANLDVLRSTASELVNAGSPLINKPLRFLYEKAAGDPTVTKFKAAHAAVVNEYAKILSGSMGAAGVTEGARHEAENMLPLDSTPAQVAAAASVLEKDAGNRLSALKAQVGATQARTRGSGPAPAGPASSPTPEAPARKTIGGKTYEKRADGWYEVG